ncbi:hypothetical protein FA95DRAFT_1555013 [Auriscalpium vulgare]|uniref:Uncharacterized protein n=1 Tax=Auriscalpium vulgare TaxID=40419 RepID=A0ACB8S3B1_9AGAM|nr:hypothetical protein FA95DRAFT_1555013 [Auriscalpium vulgare]
MTPPRPRAPTASAPHARTRPGYLSPSRRPAPAAASRHVIINHPAASECARAAPRLAIATRTSDSPRARTLTLCICLPRWWRPSDSDERRQHARPHMCIVPYSPLRVRPAHHMRAREPACRRACVRARPCVAGRLGGRCRPWCRRALPTACKGGRRHAHSGTDGTIRHQELHQLSARASHSVLPPAAAPASPRTAATRRSFFAGWRSPMRRHAKSGHFRRPRLTQARSGARQRRRSARTARSSPSRLGPRPPPTLTQLATLGRTPGAVPASCGVRTALPPVPTSIRTSSRTLYTLLQSSLPQ